MLLIITCLSCIKFRINAFGLASVIVLSLTRISLADFASKSDGLQAYLAHLKKKGRKVFGGIIANTEPRHFTGQWLVYTGKGQDAKAGDWANWQALEL